MLRDEEELPEIGDSMREVVLGSVVMVWTRKAGQETFEIEIN